MKIKQQLAKDIEEDSESSEDDNKDFDEKLMETSEKDFKKNNRKIQLVRLKSLLTKIKEKDQTQNPIKNAAFMEFKKDIMRRMPSFEIGLFSKSFYRFFSKHVFLFFIEY